MKHALLLMGLILPILAVTFVAGCADSRPIDEGTLHLTYWRTLTGAAGNAQDDLVQRYNAAHPETVVTSEFQGGYSDLATKLIAAVAARRGPDVTQLGTFEIRQFAESGVLKDLRPFLTGPDGLDTSGWPATMVEAGEVNGGIYWLPFNVAVPVLYYNQDAFKEARLEHAPETWDEFFACARKLTQKDANGVVHRTGVAFWSITWPLLSMIWSEGGELTNRDYTSITLNDPVVVRLLTEIQRLLEAGVATMPDKASGGHRAAFLSGRAAMILDSQDAFSEVFTQARGFVPALANYPAGAKGRIYAPGGGGLAMLARVPEDQAREAWSFIRFMLSPESIAYYARKSGYLAFTEASREVAGDLLDDSRYATVHAAVPYLRGDFSVNMSPAVRTAFDEAFQKIMVQRADVKATLDAADAKAEAAVAEQE